MMKPDIANDQLILFIFSCCFLIVFRELSDVMAMRKWNEERIAVNANNTLYCCKGFGNCFPGILRKAKEIDT